MSGRKGNRKNSVGQRRKVVEQQTGAAVNLNYKDTVFRMLFQEKTRLLDLYNAVSGKEYEDPEKLEIVTLENAIYMGMKNDMAFLIDFNLYLYEHQSTISKNMPFRFLQYVTAEYGRLTVTDNLYAEKLAKIPAPHFIVFYNGAAACPERDELKLSDAFEIQENDPELELRVKVLNINKGFNQNLKEQCRTLEEYMQYVDRVRIYAKDTGIEKAVDRAIDECIEQGILREFLLKSKAEVKRMSIFEYDEEATRKAISEDAFKRGMERGKQEGIEQGIDRGRQESILQLLGESGPVSSELKEEIMAEEDGEVLKKWLKLAARVESIDEFKKRISE